MNELRKMRTNTVVLTGGYTMALQEMMELFLLFVDNRL